VTRPGRDFGVTAARGYGPRTPLPSPPQTTAVAPCDGSAGAGIARLIATSLRPAGPAWERAGGVPAEVFVALAGAGAWAARWPDGGRGAGDVAVGARTAREIALCSIGAAVAVGTHQETLFPALARSEWGLAHWDAALAGGVIGALAISERGGGSHPSSCQTRALRTGGGWMLRGHKHYVSNAAAATDITVFARTGDSQGLGAFTMFLVPTGHPGVRLTAREQIGAAASGTWMLDLEEVEIESGRRVGAVGSGLPLLLELLRGERIVAAAASLAIAELCFEIALAWSERRRLGDRRLIQHQAIAHRLAALQCEIATGRALVAERIERAQRGRISSGEAAQAKLVLARLAWRVADEALQLVAGHAYMEETSLARLWRDVRLMRIGGGTDEVLLEIVAQAMRPGELAAHDYVREVATLAGG
jgi:acyl-CoA dehydrogenase/citronellyl-CoA dehydrogenase